MTDHDEISPRDLEEHTESSSLLSSQSKSKAEVAKKKARTALILALIFTTIFMVAEVVGGYVANSLAIMTDAAHLLTDIGAMLLSLFAMWIASHPPTSQMSFGFHRAEILGALASVLTIWGLTGVLIYEAILRIIHPPDHVDGKIMFFVACGGLFINVLDAFILHWGSGGHGHSHGLGGGHGHAHGGGGHGHAHGDKKKKKTKNIQDGDEEGHDHGHGHDHGKKKEKKDKKGHGHSHDEGGHGHSHEGEGHGHDHGKKKEKKKEGPTNINVHSAFIHVLGDCLQSIGVMGASALIWAKPEWKIADPIVTFIFAGLVLLTTIRLLKQCLTVLMEGVPQGLSQQEVETDLEEIPHVVEVHDLHIWSLTVGSPSLSVHLILSPEGDADIALGQANQMLRSKHGIMHTTIQIERQTAGQCDNLTFHGQKHKHMI
eukprot:TRINITY_DN2128_c0_g1_i5.p1 TRINITY_DN2128_c0_g1~~TRINITY_DN2128_c0_g1_i5.p1  ORF type:complete len:441 (-),score=119.67 TRINITY_DN2128_c0_g1_i5:48-1337(-)